MTHTTKPVVALERAALTVDGRRLWSDLSLNVAAGEFIAVLGPNGAGKTSFLRVLLGLEPLSAGTALVDGHPPRRGSNVIGYVPQHGAFDPDLPVRGRDIVRLGVDGHRFGLELPGFPAAQTAEARVDELVREVGAQGYADAAVGKLSGGEQQRLRIAQALASDPKLLLCDEPLLSLDLSHQQAVSQLIDRRRRQAGTAVIFVTHEINPILPLVDRVLYLVGGRWAVGKPDEVLTTDCLTGLYSTPVDVIRVRGRLIVVATGDELEAHHA